MHKATPKFKEMRKTINFTQRFVKGNKTNEIYVYFDSNYQKNRILLYKSHK